MSATSEALCIAKAGHDISIIPRMANRHGFIAGATGTGKTVTLRVLAEQFSSIGVPVFLADIKGDLSGTALPGGEHPKVRERAAQLGMVDMGYEGFPIVFWDVFGAKGHPLRTTVSEMGPLLIGRILNLNDIQSSLLLAKQAEAPSIQRCHLETRVVQNEPPWRARGISGKGNDPAYL